MNHLVEIKYSKNGKYPKIFINGEVISRYMSLSDYIYDDIFCWADDFFDIIDSELAEEYSVALTGHPYHEIVLREAMKKSEYCQNISFEQIQYRISIEDKYRYAMELNAAHSIVTGALEPGVKLACSNPDAFEKMGISGLVPMSQVGNYSICLEGDDISSLSGKYCVVVGASNKVVKKSNVFYLYVTAENLSALMDYLNTYHLRLAAIEAVFSKLNECALDEAEMLEFEAYSNEEYRVLVGALPDRLEVGESFEVKYQYFPKCFDPIEITVSTSNSNVVACESGAWVAKAPGVSAVSVIGADGNEYASQEIEVFKHNYVTNIAVTVPSTTMQMGEILAFNTIITPTDAEDLNEVTCRVSDESIAVLSGANQIYAISSGKVVITVSTPRVERKFEITVLALPTGLSVSSESIEIRNREEAIVHCSIIPADVHPSTTVVWSVSNKSIIRIKGSNSKRCCIEAAGEGTAILTCKIDGTDIMKKIKVTVTKKKGCYVATAVYGSYDCPEVWVLRRFRDNFLEKHWLGRRFIDMYYAVSPRAVSLFGKRKWFNRFFKASLNRFVDHLKKNGYNETPYED